MNKLILPLSLFLGFIGGYFGARLANTTTVPPTAPAPAQGDILKVKQIQLIDDSGKVRAELALGQGGSPALFFFDSKSRNRLVLGLYPPNEQEYPLVVLNDSHGNAAEILRLFGDKETPVLVQKNNGQDRTVMGLNPGSTDPFLVYYGASGKQSLFGNF